MLDTIGDTASQTNVISQEFVTFLLATSDYVSIVPRIISLFKNPRSHFSLKQERNFIRVFHLSHTMKASFFLTTSPCRSRRMFTCLFKNKINRTQNIFCNDRSNITKYHSAFRPESTHWIVRRKKTCQSAIPVHGTFEAASRFSKIVSLFGGRWCAARFLCLSGQFNGFGISRPIRSQPRFPQFVLCPVPFCRANVRSFGK